MSIKKIFRVAPVAALTLAFGLSACWKKEEPKVDETQVAPTTAMPVEGAAPVDAGATTPGTDGAAADAPSPGAETTK